MTTETILTPEQVDALLEGVLRASGSRLANYTFQKTLDDLHSSIRAIEQAVLQSPEVQALRKDVARYRFIRQQSSPAEVHIHGVELGLATTWLDDAIDEEMEAWKT